MHHLSDTDQARRFAMGQVLRAVGETGVKGQVRVLDPSGMLLGIADGRDEALYPRVVLA